MNLRNYMIVFRDVAVIVNQRLCVSVFIGSVNRRVSHSVSNSNVSNF